MLFMLTCTIEPQHRDENLLRLQEPWKEDSGVKVLGWWMSVTQLEAWALLDAPDAEPLAKLFRRWTNMNVNHVTPVLDVEGVRSVLGKLE